MKELPWLVPSQCPRRHGFSQGISVYARGLIDSGKGDSKIDSSRIENDSSRMLSSTMPLGIVTLVGPGSLSMALFIVHMASSFLAQRPPCYTVFYIPRESLSSMALLDFSDPSMYSPKPPLIALSPAERLHHCGD